MFVTIVFIALILLLLINVIAGIEDENGICILNLMFIVLLLIVLLLSHQDINTTFVVKSMKNSTNMSGNHVVTYYDENYCFDDSIKYSLGDTLIIRKK